jgi:hypothetical protein
MRIDMSQASRLLKVGDRVTTGFDSDWSGITEHRIVGRRTDRNCQSGISFCIDPPLRLLGSESWIDADWFKPIDEERT